MKYINTKTGIVIETKDTISGANWQEVKTETKKVKEEVKEEVKAESKKAKSKK